MHNSELEFKFRALCGLPRERTKIPVGVEKGAEVWFGV